MQFTIPIWAWKYIAAIIVCGAIFYAGDRHGYNGEHERYVRMEQSVRDKAAEQTRLAHEKDVENAKLQQTVERNFEDRLARNTAYWRRRLQHSTSGSGLSKASTATGKSDEKTANELPGYNQLIQDCQATTVQLESLQEWVRERK